MTSSSAQLCRGCVGGPRLTAAHRKHLGRSSRPEPPSAFDGSASPSEIRRIGRFAVEFGGMLGMVKVKIWASVGGEVLEVQFDKTANGEGIQ